MTDQIRAMIAGVATAAGEGADALRRVGIGVELEGYTIEVHLDPSEGSPAAVVTMAFGSGRPAGAASPPPAD